MILLCLAGAACSEPPPPADAAGAPAPGPPRGTPDAVRPAGAFAFAGESGQELLSLELSEAPGTFTVALCSGERHRVVYSRTQVARRGTSGRQVASNFDNEAGDVYRIVDGATGRDETCFVTTPGVAAGASLDTRAVDPACLEHQVAELARHAGREVLHCWRLAQFDDEVQALAAQFVTADTSALAAIALVKDSMRLFYAIPGTYRGPGESIWRVDDGGVFDPDAIRILFAATLPQGHAAAFRWAGAEGEANELVLADSTAEAHRVIAGYRYWSPM